MMELAEKEMLIVRDGEQYVLVKQVEIQELMDQLNEQPVWVSGMSWLTDQTGGRSPEYLRVNILYPYRKELEDFVSYPKSSGEPWRFNIEPMKKWLKNNFRRINQ